MGWYQASKQGLEGASDALRYEVASDAVSVVLVEPGIFKSEITATFEELSYPPNSRYVEAYERSRSTFARLERFFTEAGTVAKVVVKAAEARTPQARYPVGVDARLMSVTSHLVPQPIQDFFLRRSSSL